MTINRTAVFNEVKDYVFITFGLMLYTFGFTVFLLPYKIVTGGIAGIGAIVFYATHFPVQYTFFLINAVLIVAALKILGWRFLMKTIYATFMLTFLLEVAQEVVMMPDGTFYKLMGDGNDFMSLVIGCMLTGTALAIVFLNNGSTGGTDIVALILAKYTSMEIGKALMVSDILLVNVRSGDSVGNALGVQVILSAGNLCIIGSSLFIPSFGDVFHRCQMVVFGLCTMVIECLMLDYVMSVQRQSVQFLIFSKHYEDIARAITRKTDHSLTLLDGHGWYSGKEMKVICLLAKKRESVTIFRLIKMIDPQAFVSQSSVIGVYGEGFDPIKVKPGKAEKEGHNIKTNEDSIRN